MTDQNPFDLHGRLTLITGATGHLGSAMAMALAKAGSSMVLSARSQEKLEALSQTIADSFGVQAFPIAHDLSRAEDVAGLRQKVEARVGQPLDCLVNNAYFCPAESFEKMTPEVWRQGLEGTLTIPAFMMQGFLPMLTEGKGSIINIGSMYGMVAPHPANYVGTPFGSPPSYGAAKGGLLQLTRYAAAYLAPHGIRVNAISPGPFPSEKVQAESAMFIDNLSRSTPMGRIGRPGDLGGAVVFLASAASSYLNGHNLVVDGGWTIW